MVFPPLSAAITNGELVAETPAGDGLVRLITAAQAGDAEAYAAFLKGITPNVRRLVRRKRGFAGTDEVEDLVQDILLSVHVARHTYDPQRPLWPWLLAIARNRLADGARRHARRNEIRAHLEAQVTCSTDNTNSLYGTGIDSERRLDRLDLRRAIRALPPAQRTAIELLKIREMSLREAAAVTGATIGALKVATHRAMGSLRRILTQG